MALMTHNLSDANGRFDLSLYVPASEAKSRRALTDKNESGASAE
jgi:hypothetical protein